MGDKVKMTWVSGLDSNSLLIFHLLRLCPTQKQIVPSTDSTVSNVLKAEIREFCPFYPQTTFDSYRLFTQFIDSPRYQWLIGLFLLILGSLSNNDGDGYENVTKKVRSRCVKLYRAHFISFISSNLGEFIESWILKDSINNQEKKKRIVVLLSLGAYSKLGAY